MTEEKHNPNEQPKIYPPQQTAGKYKIIAAPLLQKAFQSKAHKSDLGILHHLNLAPPSETIKIRSYHALNLDRLKAQLSQEQKLEHHKKIEREVLIYKTSFFSLALLFCFLGTFALSQNLILTTTLLGNFLVLPKILIALTSFTLCLAAAMLGKAACKAKELTRIIAQKARDSMRQLYYCGVEAEFCIPSHSQTSRQDQKKQRFIYQNGMHAIQEKETATIALLKQIQKSKTLSQQAKDILSSQALRQMENDLLDIVEWSCQTSTS